MNHGVLWGATWLVCKFQGMKEGKRERERGKGGREREEREEREVRGGRETEREERVERGEVRGRKEGRKRGKRGEERDKEGGRERERDRGIEGGREGGKAWTGPGRASPPLQPSQIPKPSGGGSVCLLLSLSLALQVCWQQRGEDRGPYESPQLQLIRGPLLECCEGLLSWHLPIPLKLPLLLPKLLPRCPCC